MSDCDMDKAANQEDYRTPPAPVLLSEVGKAELLKGLKEWLGTSGERFFTWCYETHGSVSPVYSEGGMPHSVHFREGMTVRNFLRTVPVCKNWDAHQLDDNWADLVGEALELGIDKWCDGCRWLRPTEGEQTWKKEHHTCISHETILYHGDKHPRLPRPHYCTNYSKNDK